MNPMMNRMNVSAAPTNSGMPGNMSMQMGGMQQQQMQPGNNMNPQSMGGGVNSPGQMQMMGAQGQGMGDMQGGMNRKPTQQEMMMGMQQSNMYARGMPANSSYLRQSPSPSNNVVQSSNPGSVGIPSIPAPSPVLVPSPQNITQTKQMMSHSPGSALNTPGQPNSVPSPLNLQEEKIYREKYRQLTKYIEPLKRMIAKIGQHDGMFIILLGVVCVR